MVGGRKVNDIGLEPVDSDELDLVSSGRKAYKPLKLENNFEANSDE